MVDVPYQMSHYMEDAEYFCHVSGYGYQFGSGKGRPTLLFEAASGRRNAVSDQFVILVQRDLGHQVTPHYIMFVVYRLRRPCELDPGPDVIWKIGSVAQEHFDLARLPLVGFSPYLGDTVRQSGDFVDESLAAPAEYGAEF